MDAAVRTNNALRAENAVVPEAVGSGVSWASIAAGAVAAAALSLALLAFGAGLGLSSISPWADSGVSASTFKNGAGAYLVIVAVISSAVGGYLAARLRTRWVGLHTNEVSSGTLRTGSSRGRSRRYLAPAYSAPRLPISLPAQRRASVRRPDRRRKT